ncbi:AcrR family transcriptional regulator [Streptomyces zagrosensis]|uniref:AcrR family transcriptional regulator n=1 Tax=Streptomyces zagrosensis TaxID=1042984 RepID=A0A7W9V0S2_9ACTN|nr:AcrR family transcriptional regulator [Streptomyces zagrosensis]
MNREPADQLPGTVRPGGRTARTRAAVRDAVLTGLSDHGYPGLTVEYVAEHSGVHKTTLYRRWGSVDGLIADALDLAGEDSWSPPDTGTLEGDLRALANEVTATFGDRATAAAPSAFIAAAFQSERAAQGLRAFYRERFSRCGPLISRAIERGEAPLGTDAEAVARAVSAPLFFRVFVTHEPLAPLHAEQSALAALVATRAGAYVSAPTAPAGTATSPTGPHTTTPQTDEEARQRATEADAPKRTDDQREAPLTQEPAGLGGAGSPRPAKASARPDQRSR